MTDISLTTPRGGADAIRQWLIAAVTVIAGAALLASCFILYTQRNNNFHVVVPGQFYRSGRIPAPEMEALVERYHIRTVVNLEGTKPRHAWYRTEVSMLDGLGVTHIDYGLSAERILPAAKVDALLDVLRSAPKPILVHCRDGADRSGLVSALYLAKIRGVDEDQAYDQLSMAFGHFPYLGSDTGEMDDTYWLTVDPQRHPD